MISTTTGRSRIWLLVLVSLALYGLLPRMAASITLAEPSFSGDLFGWGKSISKESLVACRESGLHAYEPLGFLAVCGLLFGIYAFSVQLAGKYQDWCTQRMIFVSGAAFLLIQIFSPVMLSSDVFAYALYGRVVSIYHANPYAASPSIAAGDPFLKLFGQEYLPSWYGPFWTPLSAGIAKLGGEHVGFTVLLFRLTAIGSAIACSGLIWAILRRHMPERATQGLVFFSWNPLVVIETGLSGHNDSVMLALLLLGVWLHLCRWKTGAVMALNLSALVKFLTGMLVPLYMLLVWRNASSWRERIVFLVRAGVAVGLLCGASVMLTRSDSGSPASQAAVATDFYANNFHELLFKGLRLALGEDPDSVRSPIYFQGWWLTPKTNIALRAEARQDAPIRQNLLGGEPLVVTARQLSDQWAQVYVPRGHAKGFVAAADCVESDPPAQTDDCAKAFATLTAERPTVKLANAILRALLWAAFAGFGLVCAWHTKTFEDFLVWSAAALLASYYLIITEIWPWYVNWAVAASALATNRGPARLAILLSPCVITLYLTLGFQGSDTPWVFALRSLPAFVLPLILYVMLSARREAHRRADVPHRDLDECRIIPQ
jgi:hypothetical protein